MTESGSSLFLGTSGGIFRSDDGEIWRKASTGLEDDARSVGSLLLVGRALFAGTSGGLYRSRDGGNSWQLTAPVIGRQTIQVLTKIDNTLFVLAPGGIYRSEITSESDGAWKLLLNPESGHSQVYNVAALGNVLYVAGDRSPYQSNDRGDSWQPEMNPGLPAGWQSLAFAGGTLFAAEGDSGGAYLGGIYVSDDRAHRWLPAAWDPLGPCASAHKLAVAPDALWAGGGNGVCRSDDKGKTWQTVAGGPHLVTALCAREGALYAGTADGLYITRDRGAS